ncbi:MAG TPA: hypothetical protein VHE13_17170 [Opitutus sp.]|nr:hypothetical protein [Opitutus sp.]
MKKHFTISLALACLSLLASCANPINDYTRARYYEAGMQAEQAGDLKAARMYYGRAQINAQIGNLGPAKEAYACYEWARVTGYLGMHADSEKGFVDSLALVDKAKGEADKLRAPALAEYGRLLHDTGQHTKALPIYEKADFELQKLGILKIDALGYAAFLDDYAGSLKEAGLVDRAAAISARSATIRLEHKGETPHFEARRYKA